MIFFPVQLCCVVWGFWDNITQAQSFSCAILGAQYCPRSIKTALHRNFFPVQCCLQDNIAQDFDLCTMSMLSQRVLMGYSRKKNKRWLRTYFYENLPRIFSFFTFPLDIPDTKESFTHRNSTKLCYTPQKLCYTPAASQTTLHRILTGAQCQCCHKGY